MFQELVLAALLSLGLPIIRYKECKGLILIEVLKRLYNEKMAQAFLHAWAYRKRDKLYFNDSSKKQGKFLI